MSTSPAKFAYAPLPPKARGIRLLTLLPGTVDDPICCQLENISLEGDQEVPTYEALSYVWGESQDTVPISLGLSSFEVRTNLYDALEHLRSRKKLRKLWIDAICINQDEVSERNHQVQQMAYIYQAATRVLVWLGPNSFESVNAIHSLTKINSPSLSDAREQIIQMKGWEWENLLSLLTRPYWKRVWIIQEVVLAVDLEIICGEDKIPWRYLEKFLRIIKSDDHWSEPSFSDGSFPYFSLVQDVAKTMPARLQDQRELRSTGRSSLSSLLQDFANSLCTVAHDKVYALLGLAGDCAPDEIDVDYSKSLLEIHQDIISFYAKKNDPIWSRYNDETIVNGKNLNIIAFGRLVSWLLNCHHGGDELKFESMRNKMSPLEHPLVYEALPSDVVYTITAFEPPKDASMNERLEWLEEGIGPRILQIVSSPTRVKTRVRFRDHGQSAFFPEPLKYEYQVGKPIWTSRGLAGLAPLNAEIGDFLYPIPETEFTLVVHPHGIGGKLVGTARLLKTQSFAHRTNEHSLGLKHYLLSTDESVMFYFDSETFQLLTTE